MASPSPRSDVLSTDFGGKSPMAYENPVFIRDDMGSENAVSYCRTHFQPVSISWSNLSVKTKSGSAITSCFKFGEGAQKPIQIIQNLTGDVRDGQLLAILGSSGSGKTTFLNTLTRRNLRNLEVEGDVYLNGCLSTRDQISSCSSYVQQHDLFIGVLTVREHLTFHATLRSSDSEEVITQKVNNLITDLGLVGVADNRINCESSGQHLSGGEAKRLSIATEILTDPSILFLDEPTSGLDSFMAVSVVSVLKKMTLAGQTVLCTIHQPSSEIFAMFDNILILAEGQTAFMGTTLNAMQFFTGLGLRCPSNYNPSDFYIYQLSIVPENEIKCKQKINSICDSFSKSEFNRLIDPKRIHPNRPNSSDPSLEDLKSFGFKRSYLTQFKLVFQRSAKANLREPLVTAARIFNVMFVAILIGLLYWRQDYDQNGAQNINGAIFIVLANMNFLCIFVVVQTFCSEINIFLREHSAGLYHTSIYYFAKASAELPYFILLPILLMTLVYWMVGLYNDLETFLYANAILVLVANTAAGFGYIISSISPDVNFALSIAGPIMTPLMLFGGYFVNTLTVPAFLAWMKHISWYYYGNEIMTVNQWYQVTKLECEYGPQPNQTSFLPSNGSAPGCIQDGKGVIRMLGFDESHVKPDFIYIIMLFVAFRVISYVVLHLRVKLSK